MPQPAPYSASQPLTVPSGVANYIVWQQEELDKGMWPIGLPVRLQVSRPDCMHRCMGCRTAKCPSTPSPRNRTCIRP